MSKQLKLFLFVLILFSVILISLNFVSAVNCWDYDGTNKDTCESAATSTGCTWDQWGQYCREKGCWDYWNSTSCTAANSSGCFWKMESDMGWTTGWCEEKGACWNYRAEGTCTNVSGCLWRNSSCQGPVGCSALTESTCTGASLGCWWDYGDYCYKPGCWDYKTSDACSSGDCSWRSNAYCAQAGGNCWNYNNRTACENIGCGWSTWGTGETEGWCYQKSCWDYTTSTGCLNVSGNKCKWNNDSSYCYEKSCGSYWNITTCQANPDIVTGDCNWKQSGYCSNPNCNSITNMTTCNASVGCTWSNDYCTWKGCWNYYNSSSCNLVATDMGCQWKNASCNGGTECSNYSNYDSCINSGYACWWDWGDYCQQLDCWSSQFKTNQTTCENDTDAYNLDCTWDSYWNNCYEKWCGEYTDETECNNSISGECYWSNGWCRDKSCWGYSDSDGCADAGCSWDSSWGYCEQAEIANCYVLNQTTCNSATYNSTCKWDQWGQFCSERGCWDFTDNEPCLASNLSVSCEWTESSGGWCEDSGTKCWDYYLQTDCETNNCTWDGWSCKEKGCWDYWTNTTCSVRNATCQWTTSSSAGWDWGWCEKRSCFNWDNTNASACVNNTYNLSCEWQNTTGGWCMGPWQNNCWEHDSYMGGNASVCNADNQSGENCTWQQMDGWCYETQKTFSDFSSEGECLKSGWGKWNGTGCQIAAVTMQNPGCWIFDNKPLECSGVKGCSYNTTSGTCTGNSNGIECANVTSLVVNNQTNQTLCEVIPMLSTCCKWKAGQCTLTYDTVCWDQMAQPPVGATNCKDYNAVYSSTLCNQIAGSPWYMPCRWDNSTGQCEFKNGTANNVKDIKTKKECEFIGGTWKSENVCGTDDYAYAKSWCEAGSYGCDMACWACNSSSTCQASKKGYCQWTTDAGLLEGGYCDIPPKIAQDGDCDKFCKSCEYYSGGGYTPEKACLGSTRGCKWDNSTENCIEKKSKGCKDDCFYCYDQEDCNMRGGGSQGKCKWDKVEGMCKPSSFDKEICFDGVDNDNNAQIDCADPTCMFDPFCGGGEMGNCWKYLDNNSCISNSCSWFQDSWTQNYRCGMKGENCWTYKSNQTGCNVDVNCQWFSDTHCEINHTKSDVCFQKTTKTGCNAVNGSYCIWNADPYSPQGGWCDYSMFACGWNQTLQSSKTNCESNSLCAWTIDPYTAEGRCEPKCFKKDSSGNNFYDNSTKCNSAVTGGLCEWNTGWCEPNATSVGAVSTKDCAFYDNNQTACLEQQGCGWFEQFMMGSDTGPGGGGGFFGPQCDTKMSISCWDFKNQSTCNASLRTGGFNFTADGDACRWITEGTWAWCEAIGNHCGPMYAPFNMSAGRPQTNNDTCAADPYCMVQVDQYMDNQTVCVPKCFNSSLDTQASCEALNTTLSNQMCVWSGAGAGTGGAGGGGGSMGGWCDPIGKQKTFETMEGGAPFMLGSDVCGEGTVDANLSGWTDICGFGIKEMSEDYGIGIGINSMTYAAVCNGETLWDGSTGSGRKTTKGFWYLDTDGNETNNCMSDNGAYSGFEFKLIAKWEWSNNGLVETLTAKRCSSSNWTAANIRLQTHAKKMCGELQGMMITIKKADLIAFPNLFNPQSIMRIYAVSAGENGTSRTPADSVGPGFYKPGSVDFKKEDCRAIGNFDVDADGFYSYEDPDCKFIYMDNDRGMKVKEDCTNGIDDDRDNLLDCSDEECKNEVVCGGTLTANSSDRSAPEVKEIDAREHKNSAEIVIKTEERANITLYFYYNDSSGSTINKTVRAKGMQKANYTDERERYGFNNIVDINNMTNNLDALNYSLNNATAYYYRVEACDISGNCGKTGLLNFTTKATASVTAVRVIDPDSGENWEIDKTNTGNYTTQGQGCSLNRGGSNSTLGDVINPDTIGEINLRKTMNNSAGNAMEIKIEGIETGDDVIVPYADIDYGTLTGSLSGTTEDYIWMNESGWGGESGLYTKGHPDAVVLKLPGSDTELWDCEQLVSGAPVNCTNLTGYSSRAYNSTGGYTEWTIYHPTSDMWSYIFAQTPTTSGGDGTTTGGGGGGGGGAAAGGITYTVTEEQLTAGSTKTLVAGDKIKFAINNETHYVILESLTSTTATINVTSTPQIATLAIGGLKKFELTNDNYYDVSVKLNNINSTSNKAEFTIKSIAESAKEEKKEEAPITGGAVSEEEKGETPKEKSTGKAYLWIIAIVVIVIIIMATIYLIRRKRY